MRATRAARCTLAAACATASTRRRITPTSAPAWTATRRSTGITCRCSATSSKAEDDARRRRQPARSCRGALRQPHEQRQPARSRSAAGAGGRRRRRTAEGRSSPRVPGAHADVEPDAVAARQAGGASGTIRGQHRDARDLNQRTYRAGEEVEDYCRACKVDRSHTVIVVDGSGWPLRVQCDYCESQHNFRGGPRTAVAGRPEAGRPEVGKPEGLQLRDSIRPAQQASAPALALVSDRERTAPPMLLQNQ